MSLIQQPKMLRRRRKGSQPLPEEVVLEPEVIVPVIHPFRQAVENLRKLWPKD